MRKALPEMMKPIQADRMLEESLVLENTDLYYRPTWTFEFDWTRRASTASSRSTGSPARPARGLGDAQLTKIVSRDALFDIGADTVGMLVPGGGIAIKVARAALDKGY